MRAVFAFIFVASLAAGAEPAKDCGALLQARLPQTTISAAEYITAGKFTPPNGKAIEQLPAFCRVAGVIQPTADSDIRFEVWMPGETWNEKFLGVGNGGFAGSIGFDSMAGNLRRGYATAATDTGHEAEAEDASWAFGHPEKVTDFGFRGLHQTTEKAKELMKAFYGRQPRRSYFDSCSDGGREALMEAQRFPEDFDGILAGAPANYWTHMVSKGVVTVQKTYGNPAGYISSFKLPAIGAAARAACDAQDGVKDGIINDPLRCHFDPAVLLCKGPETRSCLTAPQIASLKVLYGSEGAPGSKLFPGLEPGGEDGPNSWSSWVVGPAPGGGSGTFYMENYFRYMVLSDPTWNPLTADADAMRRAADEKTAQALNATDPDLHRFTDRGGKLIIYHGWSDPAIAPRNAINYYGSVVEKMGAEAAQKAVRLYMVPGMQHCIGGPGPNWFGQLGTVTAAGPQHGIYDALESWVEKGTAPGEIVATKFVGDNPSKGPAMTRPLCAYPLVAKYKGSGDVNQAANFSCARAEEK